MIRIVVETLLPAGALGGVRRSLAPDALPGGVAGHLEEAGPGTAPTGSGEHPWVSCWISVEAAASAAPGLAEALAELRAAIVAAARQGGVDLLCVPAAVQREGEYLRVRDLVDGVPPAPDAA